eukprot:9736631-Ditylum_brightwellii.AAC.1
MKKGPAPGSQLRKEQRVPTTRQQPDATHNTECDKQFKQQLQKILPTVLRHQPSGATNKPNIKPNNNQQAN